MAGERSHGGFPAGLVPDQQGGEPDACPHGNGGQEECPSQILHQPQLQLPVIGKQDHDGVDHLQYDAGQLLDAPVCEQMQPVAQHAGEDQQ